MLFLRHIPLALACLTVVALAQTPSQLDAVPALLKHGDEALRGGALETVLAMAREALTLSPRSYAANHQAGVASDLLGRYAEARTYFTKAIEVAPTSRTRAEARRSIATSYAFENNCADAVRYQIPQYQAYVEAKAFSVASDIAYELGDICLEAGNNSLASEYYLTGRAAARQNPKLSEADRDLLALRHAHAGARLAARRGHNAVALTLLRSARAILDKRTHPDQESVYPYVAGYVAFYDGNYKAALPRLKVAKQDDPLVRSLIAQTYEKLGNEAEATEYYRKVVALKPAHDLATAFARPLAQRKLRDR